MARLGCLVALVGLFLAAASVFAFGAAIARLLRPSTAVMMPLPLAAQDLPVQAGTRIRVWCRLELDSGSVNGDGERWSARYAVPLTWRIVDGDRELGGGTLGLSWDDPGRCVIDEHATRASGSAVVEQPLARLALPSGAHARVTAALGEDVAWHAQVRRAWLMLREDDTESGTLALGGAAMLALGPLLMAGGLATAVLAWLRRREEKRKAPRA